MVPLIIKLALIFMFIWLNQISCCGIVLVQRYEINWRTCCVNPTVQFWRVHRNFQRKKHYFQLWKSKWISCLLTKLLLHRLLTWNILTPVLYLDNSWCHNVLLDLNLLPGYENSAQGSRNQITIQKPPTMYVNMTVDSCGRKHLLMA